MYQHVKNHFIYSICSFFKYNQFQSPMTRLATPSFDHAYPKNFQSSFNLCEIVPACKKSVSSIISFLRSVNFRVQRPDWPHQFFTMSHHKLFNQFLIFGNLYQHAKIEPVSSICSGEMLDLKILQSEWLRAFWPISQEKYFSQIDL